MRVRIWIQLLTLMRIQIRIQLFTLIQMQTQILLLKKMMRICNAWSIDPPGLHFEPPGLHNERPSRVQSYNLSF
jgi:hypothetical protein